MRMTPVSTLMILIFASIGAETVVAQQQAAAPPSKLKMTTSAYADGDWIPLQYTCGDLNGSSPGVQWSDPPEGTMSFSLIFHDIDTAPAKGATDATHWIVWNIPSSAPQLSANVQPDTSPNGIQQGKNVRGVNGYQPPCPSVGAKPHHYVFELYALDTKLDLVAGSSRTDLLKAMDGHVVGKASFVGIFGQGVDEKAWRWENNKP